MSTNKKQSSPDLASRAAKAMKNKHASEIKKKLAASVVTQARTGKQTGAKMEAVASHVLKSPKYSDETKSYAASLLSQSYKPRSSKTKKSCF